MFTCFSVFVRIPQSSSVHAVKEGDESSGTEVTDRWVLETECESLQEQQVLLTA